MSEQSPKPRGNPNWQKGGASPNPKGRPRTGLAFAERVRERVDPDVVIDLALRLAADEEVPVAVRLAALLPLIDRGFLKPPTTFAGKIETQSLEPSAIAARVAAMSDAEKIEALAAAQRVCGVLEATSKEGAE